MSFYHINLLCTHPELSFDTAFNFLRYRIRKLEFSHGRETARRRRGRKGGEGGVKFLAHLLNRIPEFKIYRKPFSKHFYPILQFYFVIPWTIKVQGKRMSRTCHSVVCMDTSSYAKKFRSNTPQSGRIVPQIFKGA